MNITCCCGKGGVGKTFTAVSLARYYAQRGEQVGVIDYDGGHSVHRELGHARTTKPNQFEYVGGNLYVAVVEETPFVSIADTKKGEVKEYLAQFPGHQGIVPFADMVMTFFGAPTDPVGLQKFARLVELLVYAKHEGYDRLIIDVEPTAGLQTMVRNAQSLTRSLVNLSKSGRLKLATLGAKWPDIKAFLSGQYIQKASEYASDIMYAVDVLRSARFLLVCIPKRSPVLQVDDVQKIIRGFNGNIVGCVVNCVTGAKHETLCIPLIKPSMPRVMIEMYDDLEAARPERRATILEEVGGRVVSAFGI